MDNSLVHVALRVVETAESFNVFRQHMMLALFLVEPLVVPCAFMAPDVPDAHPGQEYQQHRPQGDNPRLATKGVENLVGVDLCYKEPFGFRDFSRYGKNRHATVVDSLKISLISLCGLHRRQFPCRERKAHGKHSSLPMAQIIEEDNLIPFFPDKIRFRRTARRRPRLDTRIEVVGRVDAHENNPDTFLAGAAIDGQGSHHVKVNTGDSISIVKV